MGKVKELKKWRFFLSFLKERDWLEEMASKGWLLTNMNMGMRYHFKKVEPCEKVFEIDRFSVTSHATVKELNARKTAIDVATQSGWEVVTYDEDMNYYFMKDKAGDETDEFYDEEEARRERAERYRKHRAYDASIILLKEWLIVSLVILLAILFPGHEIKDRRLTLMWIYMAFSVFQLCGVFIQIRLGQYHYNELSLSREEWENRKHFSVKKRFKKVHQLQTFLQEQSEAGLSLSGYEEGRYLFEEDANRYQYFIDTKACLRKRLKEQGVAYKDDTKDWTWTWTGQSLQWYEMSMEDAKRYGLKPVGVIKKSILIYRRLYSDENIPWENGNERIGWQKPTLIGGVITIISFLFGFIMGFMLG